MELPKRYDAKEAEAKWQKYWEKKGIFKFDVNDLHNTIGTGHYIARLSIKGEKKYVKNIKLILIK